MPDSKLPYAVESKNNLRDIIGKDVDLTKVFSLEAINECQTMINAAQQNFFDDALAYLAAIDAECKQAELTPEQASLSLRKIIQNALRIRSLMESTGLIFGFEVAQSLCESLHGINVPSAANWMVIRKHMDVLERVLKDKEKSNDDPIAKDMLEGLRLLAKKAGG